MPNASGSKLLREAYRNKSTAFTREERDRLGLRGLLPYRVSTMEEQTVRVLNNLRRKEFDIEKYILLTALQERNEKLFYRVLIDHIEELMPLVYTPTVGQACKEFAHIFRATRGFYITPDDRGQIEPMLDNWRQSDVRVIVVTDGQRILGLGDLGSNGMGIPIGKLALYTACGGVHPHQCLPVMFDVGTGNKQLLEDPLYLGYPHARITGDAYLELMDEFVDAIQTRFPGALIQFEDFLTPNAYGLLERYRDRVLCFNDDIQGTAAVALAGLLAASRATGVPFKEQRILFLGAGSAATGIGDLLTAALIEAGLEPEEARGRLWFVDVHGLLVQSRDDLAPHNLPYAVDGPQADLLGAIAAHEPHVLIGATGAPGTFTEEVVRAMSSIQLRPVIFALSNPTSRAECTAKQAYDWSDGQVLFASGSPFAPVRRAHETLRPAQGNNAYVFPGVGLGAIVGRATRLNDEAFLAAAHTLAQFVTPEDLAEGALYPRLTELREVSVQIACSVIKSLRSQGLAPLLDDTDAELEERVRDAFFEPEYAT